MKVILVVSIVLFVVACSLPALEFRNSNGPNDVMLGLRALAVGWSGIFATVVAWYANPFWVLGLFLGFKHKPALAAIAGVVALGIAVTTFTLIGRELPADEGNVNKTAIIRILPGCYIWMMCFALLPVSALFDRSR